jgi:hypothetical protein
VKPNAISSATSAAAISHGSGPAHLAGAAADQRQHERGQMGHAQQRDQRQADVVRAGGIEQKHLVQHASQPRCTRAICDQRQQPERAHQHAQRDAGQQRRTNARKDGVVSLSDRHAQPPVCGR